MTMTRVWRDYCSATAPLVRPAPYRSLLYYRNVTVQGRGRPAPLRQPSTGRAKAAPTAWQRTGASGRRVAAAVAAAAPPPPPSPSSLTGGGALPLNLDSLLPELLTRVLLPLLGAYAAYKAVSYLETAYRDRLRAAPHEQFPQGTNLLELVPVALRVPARVILPVVCLVYLARSCGTLLAAYYQDSAAELPAAAVKIIKSALVVFRNADPLLGRALSVLLIALSTWAFLNWKRLAVAYVSESEV